jgi:endonuclease III
VEIVPMPAESPTARKKRAATILAGLKTVYPDADCALRHSSALELLVATVLSAQSTDETVNRVTRSLFAKYRTPADYADAPAEQLEDDIHATGFFRQKTKSIQGACRIMIDRFGGQVPETMEELIELPGVARKTANVILGTWFKKNEGIVVDTHVGRLAHRMGLTWTSKDEKDAVRIENDLVQLIPREEWTFFGHAMIWHGRRVCAARKPDCATCQVARHCPSAFTFDGAKKAGSKPAKATRPAAGRRK